jgi:pyrroline-5-carboxylate reductase
VIQYDWNDRVRKEDLEVFLAAMQPAGLVDHVPERLIDAGSAVAGSGPAFVSMFVEALADGGVACGLPRAKAVEYAAQTLIGTARLMLESGDHPGAMKDAVCSPGGSTIQGVRKLEQGGFRSAIMEAVIATWEKNKEFIK